MKTSLIALCVLCAVLAACSSKNASEMKPGLWETRVVSMTMDGRDMLPMMKAAQGQTRGGDPTVQRMCVSAEMAKNAGRAMLPKQANVPGCDQPKMDRSGNRMTFEISCKANGGTTSIKGENVVDGDEIASKAEVETTVAGATHTMVSETQMKFLGSDCGDLKPHD